MTIGSRPHKARKPAARALKSPPSLRGRIPVASRVALSASVSDVRGVGQLAVAAVIETTQLVEEMHARIVRAVPVVGKPTASALLSIPTLAYRSVRGVTRLVGAAVDTVLACAESRRSTRLSTAEADLGTAPTPQEPEGFREPSPEAHT